MLDEVVHPVYPCDHEPLVAEVAFPHLLGLAVKDVADADEFRTGGNETSQGFLLFHGHHLPGLVSEDGVMDVQALGYSALGGIFLNPVVFFFREADIDVMFLVLPRCRGSSFFLGRHDSIF